MYDYVIDLYDCKNKNEFIEKLDKIIQNISSFHIEFRNLNNFDNETLYIEPLSIYGVIIKIWNWQKNIF